MPGFGERSLKNLATCDSRLQKLFMEVVKTYDCSVICGHRTEEDQGKAFDEGKSKLRFPNSKHNSYPSKAADVVPYPINWDDTDRFYHFAGFVQGVARSLGIGIRWGGDFDGDFNLHNEGFIDMPHFELVED